MITSQMCFYPLYFRPPSRRETFKPGTGRREGGRTRGREGVTLKEDERRGRAAVPNTFPACEQICPRGGRQLTNYVRAKRLAFGPGYHLCRQTVFNRNMEKQRGEASVSRRAPPPESGDETTLSPPPRGVRRCSGFKFPPRASPRGGGGRGEEGGG